MTTDSERLAQIRRDWRPGDTDDVAVLLALVDRLGAAIKRQPQTYAGFCVWCTGPMFEHRSDCVGQWAKAVYGASDVAGKEGQQG